MDYDDQEYGSEDDSGSDYDSYDSDAMDVDIPEGAVFKRRRKGGGVANHLSHDVLHYLFAFCLRTLPNQRDLPVVLSHVCASWRFTALKSPFLWTSVFMHCMRGKPRHLWVKIRLRRSKHLPVNFIVNTVRPFEVEELNYIILSSSYRFRKLSITVSSHHLIPELFKRLLADMPLLEHFEFQVKGDRHRARMCVTRNPRLVARDAPFRFPPVKRNSYKIVWSDWQARGLTSLIIDYFPLLARPTVTELHTILANNSSSLERMEFRGFAPELILSQNPTGWTHPMIILPALRSLTIGYIYPGNYVPVFLLFSAPNLARFYLRDIARHNEADTPSNPAEDAIDAEESPDAGPLLSFLTQANAITHLTCFGVKCDEAAAVAFMQSLTKLRSATLYDSEHALFNTICTSLPAKPPSSLSTMYVGASLSHLLITNTTGLMITGYLSLRAKAGLPPLKKLTFSSDCILPPELQKQLQMSFLEWLASGAETVTIVPIPKALDMYVPWQEHTLLTDREVNPFTWTWFVNSPEFLDPTVLLPR
jgi:hypothetical protein